MRILMKSDSPRDGGVAAVYVAMSLFLIFGAGAVAVDAGSMYETKRDIVADTDAAALAAARVLDSTFCTSGGGWTALAPGNPGYDVAVELLENNQGSAPDPARLKVEQACNEGIKSKVRVTYAGEAQLLFASLFGFNELNVEGSSTAAVEPQGGGLRPFGVCASDPGLLSAIAGTALDDGYPVGDQSSFRLWMVQEWNENQGVTACNGSSGNWSYACFDSHLPDGPVCQGGDLSLEHLVLEGYPADIDLGENTSQNVDDEDCHLDDGLDGYSSDDPGLASPHDPESASWCDIATGLHSNIFPPPNSAALGVIRCAYGTVAENCTYQFPILVVTGSIGTGSKAVMNPWAFLGVVLRDTGSEKPPWGGGNSKFIEFEVTGLFPSGNLQEVFPVKKIVQLCGVDGDPSGDRCGF